MVGSFLSLAPKSSATDFVIFLVFETIWFPMTFQSFHAHNLWPVFRGSSQRLTWFLLFAIYFAREKILKLFTYMAFQKGKRKLENSITFQFFPWCIWTLVYSYGVVERTFLSTIFFLLCLESSALSLVSLSGIVFIGRGVTPLSYLTALPKQLVVFMASSNVWYKSST